MRWSALFLPYRGIKEGWRRDYWIAKLLQNGAYFWGGCGKPLENVKTVGKINTLI